MPSAESRPVGYVVKRYPRYSETFIVNEILAHEAAGLPLEIFSLLPCTDSHFQDCIARVRSPVTYLLPESPRASDLWAAIQTGMAGLPGFDASLRFAVGAETRDLFQSLQLAMLCRRRGIAHLHAHFATSPAAVARLAARLAGISYSFTAHAKDIFHRSVVEADLGRKLNDAAFVVTVSEYNRRYLTDRHAGARVHRIYNGMHLERLEFRAPRERAPLILGVGRLVEKKGFDDLIAACANLRDRGIDFRCQIIGTGEDQARLAQLIADHRVGDRLELTGPRPQTEVFDAMASACALAAPCVVGQDDNRDGLPTVLLEAMALGTACVSTDVTGIPEVIRHGQTGLAVPQRDPSALADSLARLIEDASLRVSLATRARQLIEREFDVRANTAHLRALFAEASAGRG